MGTIGSINKSMVQIINHYMDSGDIPSSAGNSMDKRKDKINYIFDTNYEKIKRRSVCHKRCLNPYRLVHIFLDIS